MIRIRDKFYETYRFNCIANSERVLTQGYDSNDIREVELIRSKIIDLHTQSIIKDKAHESTRGWNIDRAITNELNQEHRTYMMELQSYVDPIAYVKCVGLVTYI
jgi:hypothetical protein